MTITDRLGRTVDGTDSSARPADPNPGLAIKTPCRAATTANITLNGLQTIDGITLVDAERVLVKNQTDTSLNGIYNASSGNWTRAKDWDGGHEVGRGTRVLVTGGTANALKDFSITSADPLSIGTSSVVITELAPGPELAALAALATTGLMVRTGALGYTTRSIVGTANEITVANGSGISANPTISLPTALTFTGKAITGGTFSGITLTASDSALTLQDNGDATKQLQFQLSGITTGTTRTLTIPDASGTLALTSNKLSAFAATTSAEVAGVLSDETGSGPLVFANSPTLVTPALGTPSAVILTNATGTASGLTAGHVTTNANLTGDVTSVGNATTLAAGNAGNLNSGTLLAARMPALTGDITTSAGAVATTLATVNSNVGTFGSATQAAQVTVNGKGLVTAAANVTITPAVGSITGLGTGVATALALNIGSAGAPVTFNGAGGTPSSITLTNGTGLPTTGLTGTLQAAQEPAHTGDVTNSAGSLALAIGATKVTSAMLNADVFSTAHSWAGQQTFVAPILGTPASGVATNLTGTAASLTAGNVTTNANLTGAVTSVGNATSLGSFSSANLRTALTDETGTGAAVFGTNPTFADGITVTNGINAGTFSNVIITIPASTATLTIASGKTLQFNSTMGFSGTDGTVMTFPATSATIARTDAANTFTGHQTIEGVTSTGATGTGKFVFDASPALTGTPTAPTAAVDTSTTQIATTAMVLAQAASATPLIDSTAAVGTSTRYARADHVHPTDTTRQATLTAGQLPGTATNDNATAGNVGEIRECKAINTGAGVTATVTIASPGVVTWTAHTLSNDGLSPIRFTTTGALPTGLTAGTIYWTVPGTVTANTFQLATSIANAIAGTAINTSGSQSGTHTLFSRTVLTTGTTANFCALSLTAGDWEVTGTLGCVFGPAANVTYISGGWATAITTVDQTPGRATIISYAGGTVLGNTVNSQAPFPTSRLSISATTTVYAFINVGFTVDTAEVFGSLTARRMR